MPFLVNVPVLTPGSFFSGSPCPSCPPFDCEVSSHLCPAFPASPCSSETRTTCFHKVVPVERLLSALAVAPQDLAERIQHLLLPSYFPDGAEGPARIAALLRRSPAAGRAFCGSLARSAGSQSAMPLEQLVALVNSLKGHLLASSRLLQGVREGRDKGVKRRADSEGAEEPPVDMAQPREVRRRKASSLLSSAGLFHILCSRSLLCCITSPFRHFGR